MQTQSCKQIFHPPTKSLLGFPLVRVRICKCKYVLPNSTLIQNSIQLGFFFSLGLGNQGFQIIPTPCWFFPKAKNPKTVSQTFFMPKLYSIVLSKPKNCILMFYPQTFSSKNFIAAKLYPNLFVTKLFFQTKSVSQFLSLIVFQTQIAS